MELIAPKGKKFKKYIEERGINFELVKDYVDENSNIIINLDKNIIDIVDLVAEFASSIRETYSLDFEIMPDEEHKIYTSSGNCEIINDEDSYRFSKCTGIFEKLSKQYPIIKEEPNCLLSSILNDNFELNFILM